MNVGSRPAGVVFNVQTGVALRTGRLDQYEPSVWGYPVPSYPVENSGVAIRSGPDKHGVYSVTAVGRGPSMLVIEGFHRLAVASVDELALEFRVYV